MPLQIDVTKELFPDFQAQDSSVRLLCDVIFQEINLLLHLYYQYCYYTKEDPYQNLLLEGRQYVVDVDVFFCQPVVCM